MNPDNPLNVGDKLIVISEALYRNNFNHLIELLDSWGKRKFYPISLYNTVSSDREHLVYTLLCELGVVSACNECSDEPYGYINRNTLNWLRDQLGLVTQVIANLSSQQLVNSDAFQELAWTLPDNLADTLSELPAKQSLAALTKYAISLAQQKLVLVSPFLDEGGAKLLEIAVEGAAKRGVHICLIAHGLDRNDEFVKRTLDIYRQASPTIDIYTGSNLTVENRYLILHAKLIISDSTYAVLSTANLTQYGLKSHLEVGVGLKGKPVRQLAQLIDSLLQSNLVVKIT